MEQGRDSFADFPSPAHRLAELEALVAEQQATITAYQQQLERAHEQLLLLKRALFSSRRERYVPSPDQRLLFPSPACEPPPDADLAAGEEEPACARPTPPRRRGRRFVFPEGLPRRRIE